MLRKVRALHAVRNRLLNPFKVDRADEIMSALLDPNSANPRYYRGNDSIGSFTNSVSGVDSNPWLGIDQLPGKDESLEERHAKWLGRQDYTRRFDRRVEPEESGEGRRYAPFEPIPIQQRMHPNMAHDHDTFQSHIKRVLSDQ